MPSFKPLKDSEAKHKKYNSEKCKEKCKIFTNPGENKMCIVVVMTVLLICIFIVTFKIYLQKFHPYIPLNLPPLRKSCPPPPKNPELAFTVEELLDGPVSPSDKRVMKYIRTRHLTPPSTLPYNTPDVSDSKLLEVYLQLFSHLKSGGVFVDVGALDGVENSMTLSLEKKHGWTGVLIEPDYNLILELKEKHRKAWIAHGCVSPFNYPRLMQFSRDGKYVSVMHRYGKRNLTCSTSDITPKGKVPCEEFYSQCYPLETYLNALEYKKVNLLSLHLQGEECDILRTISLKKYGIEVVHFNVQQMKGEEIGDCTFYLQNEGYMELDTIAGYELSKIVPGSRFFSRNI